jgi:hypothetical protein
MAGKSWDTIVRLAEAIQEGDQTADGLQSAMSTTS